ncbi:MAG: hypothetical protein K9J16_15215 [Melioribacteraceae bacterium]|nr:hypothetical protein [Melioribacteraceae bacterium]MCF8353067.1 hypothetical protein [Melioribacteraceae bacterium]MCF8392787.1 hypothetical protein [Melioribacteraceae bacterium]MCF8418318.1 hypothetical protein [Melioribacteraceae bacterium]
MKRLILLIVFGVASLLVSCSCEEDKVDGGDAAHSAVKDESIQEYNLEVAEEQAAKRTPCDTLALKSYILENYPEGTYLVEFDKTYTSNIPKSAVIYYKSKNEQYIFAVIAKSKPGERFIEKKNVIGYESSFINLDSTKLGTAFFWLTLFTCDKDEGFSFVWESEVPIHGGFNSMALKTWKPKKIRYIELNYEDGIISGHRNYNFYLVDGINNPPHLMETYVGLVHKRTMANVNNDFYPDYYEYRFIEDSLRIAPYDSIPFYWDTTKSLYVTKVNSRWFRQY